MYIVLCCQLATSFVTLRNGNIECGVAINGYNAKNRCVSNYCTTTLPCVLLNSYNVVIFLNVTLVAVCIDNCVKVRQIFRYKALLTQVFVVVACQVMSGLARIK